MTEASWDTDRIRLRGLSPGAEVRVHVAAHLRPMAGRVIQDGDDCLFVPRFPFVDGTSYTVRVGGDVVATLTRPRPVLAATTSVVDIYPTAPEVPRNLLRCYVRFSAPMAMGYAGDHLRLIDANGEVIEGALLPADHELWSADRTRLTVLLDPGRIKRGLGRPTLMPGTSFRLVVDKEFRDAQGIPLVSEAARSYRVVDDERRRVDPSMWKLFVSPRDLVVEFDRPMDHGLLAHCLQVTGVDGTPEIGPDERSWRLTPRKSWTPGEHQLVVSSILEDVAGNSVARVFDRDLDRAEDSPGPTEPTVLRFVVNP